MALHLPWETGELRKAAFEICETKAEAGSSESGAARKGKAALLSASPPALPPRVLFLAYSPTFLRRVV